jgi:hypothetical protein
MPRTVAIGLQDFGKIRTENCFYVDKTNFIKEWWENRDDVTLITRPRRFGKTLNMSMMEYFFSVKHKAGGNLFDGLVIWNEEKYRQLQGTYPVISLSLAPVKSATFPNALKHVCNLIMDLYNEHLYLLESDILADSEKDYFRRVNSGMDEAAQFFRNFMNATFKTNPYMEKSLITGITRISKESMFSDLNNLEVVTITSEKYATAFGFTEQEVFEGKTVLIG